VLSASCSLALIFRRMMGRHFWDLLLERGGFSAVSDTLSL